jgi:AsmA protein
MLTLGIKNLPKHLKRPLSRRIRNLLIGALAGLGLFALFQIVAPFLISSTLVRAGMEEAVAEWTGHDVTIEGSPDIRFWPEPRITLRDITIRKPVDGGKRVLGRVARLSASFDLLQTLIGQPEFKDFRLTDPQIYVLREPDGRLDWTNDGLLSRAVREAKPDANGQLLAADADAPMGEVRITNGTLEISDVSSGRTARFAAIEGDLHWPWLSRGMEIKARGELNGRKLSVDFNSAQPLLLLAGGSGNASGTIVSDIFQGRFQGVASLATHAFLSGDAELTIPDLATVMAWSGVNFPGAERIKRLSLSAHLVTNENTLRFENLSLGLNEDKATGILDLMLPANRLPRLTGTLAFDRLDLSGIVDALTPAADEANNNSNVQTGIEFDLRLSAEHAMLGPLRLSEAAVSVLDTPTQSRVDIVDSDFETGRLTGRLATAAVDRQDEVALHIAVQGADFGNVIKNLGLGGPLPVTRGSLDLSLNLRRPITSQAWRDAEGHLRFRGEKGFLPGVDIAGVRQLATQKPYFSLSEAGSGNLEFDSVDLSARITNGSAEIDDGKINGSDGTLTISGVVPYASNSLALSATVHPAPQDPAQLTVFIGGSWPNPVIWPVSQTAPKPAE